MAQTADYVVSNDTASNVRTDLNSIFQAILSANSGATEPANPVAYMSWVDTSTSPATIKLRDGTNTGWIVRGFADNTAALGTATAPSYTFTGDTNTGIYSPGADQVGITAGGTLRLTISTAATFTVGIRASAGTAAAPSFTFSGDTNTGFYSASANVIGITTDGAQRASVGSTGIVNLTDTFRISTAKTPASATATGTTGDICWDASYIYVCTATNTWKRVAISTW